MKSDADFSKENSRALRNLADALNAEQIKRAESLAADWSPDAATAECAMLEKIKSAADYNRACQKPTGASNGHRNIDELVRTEVADGR